MGISIEKVSKPKISICPVNEGLGIGWTCVGKGYRSFGMTVRSAYFHWKNAVVALEAALWHDIEVEG